MRPLIPGLRGMVAALVLSALPAYSSTLQEQIDAAAPGSTITVPPGVHAGSIVINKPLTLVAEHGAIIEGPGKGKVVHIAADDVTLRGFTVRGSGLALFDDDAAIYITGNRAVVEANIVRESLHGIYLKKASDCRLIANRVLGRTDLGEEDGSVEDGMGQSAENCDTAAAGIQRGNGIHLWNCERTEIIGNEIRDVRDGIYFSFANHTVCERNWIHRSRYGLHYMYSDDNVFTGNTFSENAAGAALMFSKKLEIRRNHFVNNRGLRAYGLIFQSMDDCRLEANVVQHNAVGLSFNQCNRNRVIGNRVTHNYIGLRFGSNSDENAFSTNVFVQNLHPVEIGGENGTNVWSLAGVGNLWGDSMNFDLDQDQINDLPHRELDLFGPLRREFPSIALLSESPLMKLLRFAHQRAALPGASSIQDSAPLAPGFPALRALQASHP